MQWGTVPAWGPTVVAILSLLFAAYSYRANRKNKVIEHEVLFDQPLFNSDAAGYEQLTVTHGAVVLTKPRSVSIALANVGNGETAVSDYSEPITVRLKDDAGGCTTIVTATARSVDAGGHMRDLEISHQGEQEAQIAPLLLNPGDSVVFQLLVDGEGTADVFTKLAGFRLIPIISLRDVTSSALELLEASSFLFPPGALRTFTKILSRQSGSERR